MRASQPAAVLDGVRRIFGGGTASALGADGLLGRFVARNDEAAFDAIVARHGPMVLGVARRMLGNPHDVEDAFQATFLVFVRKAGAIRDAEGLGPWLHGVARRVAARARARSIRRSANERPGLPFDPPGPPVDPDAEEIRGLVDEEIGRLPDRYRRVIVLCDLEGCSQPEAALRLDWTEGSVRGRLARGRALLRTRLARRGLGVSAGLLAGLFTPDAASAARLAASTTTAILKSATSAPGGVPATAVALAKEVLMAMLAKKLGTIALGAVVAGATLSGSMIAYVRAQEPDGRVKPDVPPRRSKAPQPDLESADLTVPPPYPVDPRKIAGVADPINQEQFKIAPPPEPASARRIAVGDFLEIEVLDVLPGRPITGERLVRPDGTVSLGFYGDLKLAGLTRREAKVKVIELLRAYLTDQQLGLYIFGEAAHHWLEVHPAWSDRVYVDDSPTFDPRHRTDRDPTPLGRNALARSNQLRTHPEANPGTPKPSTPKQAAVNQSAAGPTTFKTGDRVVIEVVQALPSRPIEGDRVIRPDGTVSLGFYGDLEIAGLTRQQAKVKVIEHLRQWLDEELLGLVTADKDGVKTRVAPERSTCVLVDEADDQRPAAPGNARLREIELKLDRVLDELEALRRDKGN